MIRTAALAVLDVLAAVAARERGRAVAVLLLRDLVALARVRVAARTLVWVTRLLLVALIATATGARVLTRRADADALVHFLCALATLAAHALCDGLVAATAETQHADTELLRAPAGVTVAAVRRGRHAEALCDELVAVVARHVLACH